jgi:hypothetical protein
VQGWRRAGLPVAGESRVDESLRVSPQELSRALEAKLSLRLLDLRSPAEREQGPVAGAQALPGTNLDEKLAQVRQTLERESRQAQKNLAQNLRPAPTTVLLVPMAADAGGLVTRNLWGLAADVRYVEGGYLAATPRQKVTVSNVEGCATCPGGKTQGELK